MSLPYSVVCICGGRDFIGLQKHINWLDKLQLEFNIRQVIHGCQTGADTFGDKWAKSKGLTISPFPAEWTKYGNSAGPIRNEEMANFLYLQRVINGRNTYCIAFPGGKGTSNMLQCAMRKNIPVIQYMEF